jgi:CspA family cold shock protein
MHQTLLQSLSRREKAQYNPNQDQALRGVMARGVSGEITMRRSEPAPAGCVSGRGLAMEDDRLRGTVKFFNEAKGYGFIVPDGGGADIFVHVSAVQRSGLSLLENGARVTFATEPDRRGKGPKAVDLKVETAA